MNPEHRVGPLGFLGIAALAAAALPVALKAREPKPEPLTADPLPTEGPPVLNRQQRRRLARKGNL